MKLDDAIKSRRSVRKFSSKKVRWDYVLEAIDAANNAPFAGNINNLQFIIIENEENKKMLAEQSQQLWISEAKIIVVIFSSYKHLKSLYDERAERYGRQHAGAAIENFLLKIADLGLSSCWVGAFLDDKIKEKLKIPKEMELEAILPVGHHKEPKKIKSVRKNSLEKSIHWENYGNRNKPEF